jgi:hypothetical protein
MMSLVFLLVLVFLAKIVLIDSPVGQALGDAIRGMVPPRVPEGSASRGELDQLRRDVEELRDRVDRIVDEQEFLTRLLAQPRQRSLGPGEVKHRDS